MNDSQPTLTYGVTASPFGPCLLACREKTLVYLGFLSSDESPEPLLAEARITGKLERDDIAMEAIADKVFSGNLTHFEAAGTPFQQQVWAELRRIPAGETRTYAQIAQAIGQPQAVRAVGTAIGRNPLAYLIPCHRVVRTDGSLGGFRWGLAIKRRLLDAEAQSFACAV